MSGPGRERRANRELREVLDELVEHVRNVTRNAKALSQKDLDSAEERLDWLAEEVWRVAVESHDKTG